MRQILIIAFLMFFNIQNVFSQIPMIKGNKKLQKSTYQTNEESGLFFELNLGSYKSQIVNGGNLSISELISSRRNSFFGTFEFGYFLSNYFGLSTGIGYTLHKSRLTIDNYENELDAIDSENEPFELRITGYNIEEIQDIGLLNIPVSISVRLPFSKTIAFFIQPGVNIAFPITKTYSSTGIFTYKGYYPSYNVLLENLPEYGLPSDKSIESADNLELKQLYFNFALSAGFDFYPQDKFQVIIAAVYNKSLTKITEYDSNDNFQLTTNPDQINSMIGEWDNATIHSLGLKLSIRFYIR